jgi:hypothetical protein
MFVEANTFLLTVTPLSDIAGRFFVIAVLMIATQLNGMFVGVLPIEGLQFPLDLVSHHLA